MIGIGIGIDKQHLPASTQHALVTAWAAATGVTDPTLLGALNTLVTGMDGAGILNLYDCIYVLLGGSASANKYNLINAVDSDAAYRLTFAGGLTHQSSGVLPDGTTGYANTHWTPSVDASGTAGGMGYYSRTNESKASIDIGSYGGGGENDIYIVYPAYGSFYMWNNSGSATAVTNADSRGWYRSNRTATNQQGWKNGVKVIDEAKASGASTYSTYLFCGNAAGTANYFSGKECALAVVTPNSFTAGQLEAEYTLINAFMTTLGINV